MPEYYSKLKNMTSVDKLNFLGVTIARSGYCTDEIKRRIILGKVAAKKLNKVIKDSGVSVKTKIKIFQTIVFPIVLYGCESWTLRMADKRKLDAFEMWSWRKILKVSWAERRTNLSILKEIKPDCSLETKAYRLKLRYFEHIMRKYQSLEKDIMLGTIEGKRGRE